MLTLPSVIFDTYGEIVAGWVDPALTETGAPGRYFAVYRFDRSTGDFTLVAKPSFSFGRYAFVKLQP